MFVTSLDVSSPTRESLSATAADRVEGTLRAGHEVAPSPWPAGLADFYAYANVGEDDVFRQFDAYAAGIGDEDARRVFREAKLDELGHVGLTRGLLLRLTGDERTARRKVLWVRLTRLWDAWLRFGKAVGELNASILLGALYIVAAPLLTVAARRRLVG